MSIDLHKLPYNVAMPTEPPIPFKFWLRKYRLDQKLSQDDLGAKVGVTHVTVGQWERGTNKPEPPTLEKLADVTGRDPVELFNEVYGLSLSNTDKPEDERLKRISISASKLSDATIDQLVDYVTYLEQGEREKVKRETKKKVKASVDSNR
jgi:transcriptional regulator with XRE-family HTH domain